MATGRKQRARRVPATEAARKPSRRTGAKARKERIEGVGPATRGKFSPEKRRAFLELYATGVTVATAARRIGVSSVAVFNHIRKDPDGFGAAYRAAMETNTDVLEDGLHTLAREGNVAAIFGTLKARRPERWRDRVDLSNADGSLLKPLAEAIRRAHANITTTPTPPSAGITAESAGQ